MNKKMILIAGGAGYIGSHVNHRLAQLGYETVVLDNLSKGDPRAVIHGHFIEGDVGNRKLLEDIFKAYPIDTVMHFAAAIDVGESMLNPSKYYFNNVVQTLNLLEAMKEHQITSFIFSSTAAIFGTPLQIPVSETHPPHPINPYGRSKLMIEQVLQDYDNAYGIKFICLRYFNAAGGDPEGQIKNYKKKESNLIPVALRTLLDDRQSITIFGTDYPSVDGTCIRDYIHVYDLADAHILAMKHLQNRSTSCHYNLGNGQGFTVKQVIQTIESVTQKKLKVIEGPRRPGDPPILISDSTKATTELGWKCHYPSLEIMIKHAWQALI